MRVEVYGGKHSPWVQAVLLALHEKGIEHILHPLPPLVAGLRQWLASMHERFRGYPHLYSGSYFEPYLPQPVPAGPVQRAIFLLRAPDDVCGISCNSTAGVCTYEQSASLTYKLR